MRFLQIHSEVDEPHHPERSRLLQYGALMAYIAALVTMIDQSDRPRFRQADTIAATIRGLSLVSWARQIPPVVRHDGHDGGRPMTRVRP